jgi:hypothetical protein
MYTPNSSRKFQWLRVDVTEFGGLPSKGDVNRQHQLYAYAHSEYVICLLWLSLRGLG